MTQQSRSHRANHYGTLVERKAVERYDLELERCSWYDAKRPDGTPVEIKAAMREHADGQTGTFKLYQEFHNQLRKASGYYVFAPYRIRGRGIEVLQWELRHSSQVPRLDWHGGGSHRNTQQAKLRIEDIFHSI